MVGTRAGRATRFGGPEALVTSEAPDPVADENDEGEMDHASTRPWAPRFLRIYGTADVVERDGYVGQGTYLRITPTISWSWNLAYEEWNRKPVAFVSYGGHAAGYRAAEQLRQVSVELQMVPIREQVGIQSPWTAFDAQGHLTRNGAEEAVGRMVGDLLWWTHALRRARTAELTPA